MRKIKYTKEILEPIVLKNINVMGVIKDLGLSYCNGSRTTIFKAIQKHQIDTSHFGKSTHSTKEKSYEELFIKDCALNRTVVRKKLIKNNLIPYMCAECGCDDNWRGKKMPLILDHANGINNDNRLENLRFLCSNCDSIQDTYKGKNRKSSVLTQIKRDGIHNEYNQQQKINKKESTIKKIKELEIDFKSSGWRVKLGNKISWTPQYAGKFIEKYIPEIWETAFKHKDNIWCL